MDAVVLGAGEGEVHTVGPSRVTIKAGGDETAGTFYLGEAEIEPGFPGPPSHIHERLHDMFYVLKKRLTVQLGDAEVEATPARSSASLPGCGIRSRTSETSR